jgi:predicted translin family RNA/ssDNA-binding protein
MEKAAGSPLFPLNPRKLSQKLKFWESLYKELFMADMAQNIEEIQDKQDNEEITLESAFGLWKDRKIYLCLL